MNKYAQEIYDYIKKLNRVIDSLRTDYRFMFFFNTSYGNGFMLLEGKKYIYYIWDGQVFEAPYNINKKDAKSTMDFINEEFKVYKNFDLNELLTEV